MYIVRVCITTDYRKIDFLVACEGFLTNFDKNLSQATKIFFGCRNDEMILIPMRYFVFLLMKSLLVSALLPS
jgi:hypothetical protein